MFKTRTLSNIPDQFAETLKTVFEDLAYAACYGIEEWKDLEPIDLAAEVGDIIERDLEIIAHASKLSAPTRRSSSRTAISVLTTLSVHVSFGDFDYWQKTSLLAYQYDLLCWLYSRNKIPEAFEVYELILRTFSELSADFSHDLSTQAQKEKISEAARTRALKRHAPTNKIKHQLLEEWRNTSSEYESRADFCRIVSRREGLKERTVYEWIQKLGAAND
ncbi:hypothetical protein [Pseudomonas turukhanskensis]|nr:hypothetical protein [Pseudomonas turukhanskensis]